MAAATKSVEIARKLRSNATDSETRLWSCLRRRQIDGRRFRRQVPLGRYVVDFICLELRLAIEVDGGQHANREPEDEARTAWLESQGFKVMRFWNSDVLSNAEGVIVAIRTAVEDLARLRPGSPHPNPPPQGGRELSAPRRFTVP